MYKSTGETGVETCCVGIAAKASPPAESTPLAARNVDDTSRWRHISACVGFLADSYDVFTIDLVILILGLQYGSNVIGPEQKSLVVSTMIAGIIFGQLSFGFVADWVGRKWAFVATAGLTVIGALMSAMVVNTSSGFSLAYQLAASRFLLGLGVGGEYPLSASVMTESIQDAEGRGVALAMIVSMQGWGMLLSSVLALVAMNLSGPGHLEAVWRLLLAAGAVPSLFAFVLRWRMHESTAFTEASAHDADRYAGRPDLAAQLGTSMEKISRHSMVLVGTASAWFLTNLSMYSLGSFKSQILSSVLPETPVTAEQQVLHGAVFAGATSVFALLGCFAAMLLINRLGRYRMQLFGFLVLTVIFFSLGILGQTAPWWTLLLLTGITFFFQNLGPNTTTYIIAAEAFPTLIRGSCHGISAATGKLGALVGTALFPVMQVRYGLQYVYFGCCIAALTGAVVTYAFTPRLSVSLAMLDSPYSANASKKSAIN